MTVTADRTALRGMDDAALAALYASADEPAARAVLAECARRDRLAAWQERKAQVRAEWHERAYADYLAADEACKGELMNPAGVAAGVATDFDLWSGPRWLAEKYATDELLEWWETRPRITVTEYAAMKAADQRIARLEAGEARDDSGEDIAREEFADETTEVTDDEHAAEYAEDSPVVAGHEAVGLRLLGAADPVRAGGAGRGDGAAQGGQVRDAGPVLGAGRGWLKMPLSYDDERMGPLDRIDLWQDRIPCGDVTLLYGSGAVGKGRMTCDLIGRITTGRPMPLCGPETAAEPGSVIVILPEDDPNEQVAHRLRAAGADLSRVYDLTRLAGGTRFKLSANGRDEGHLAHLRGLVDHLEAAGRNPRLIVIDPLAAVLGWGTIATNAGARRLVEPLQDMAKDTGVAVLVVAHTVKSGLLQGSAGLPQALRTVWKVSPDKDNPAYRVLTLEKANNLPAVEPARYTVTGDESGAVRVEWLDLDAVQDQRRGWRDRLAARQARREGAGAPLAPAPPVPAAGPRFCAVALTPGSGRPHERILGDAQEPMAKMVCEARAGRALEWQPDGKGGWQAWADGTAYAVGLIGARVRAV